MAHHYLLWCTGQDRPGIVAGVTKIILKNRCNLEESAMSRLGGEFGILLIFSSEKMIPKEKQKALFAPLVKKMKLSLGLKSLSGKEARFKPLNQRSVLMTAHGQDRPGIVFELTRALAAKKVNITDLNTHRSSGKKAGFIVMVEGELPAKMTAKKLERSLQSAAKKLKLKITVQDLRAAVA